jgi:hypothetical protein
VKIQDHRFPDGLVEFSFSPNIPAIILWFKCGMLYLDRDKCMAGIYMKNIRLSGV